MKNSRIGVYPGTFDPLTNGHLDIIVRASRVVDRFVIAVASNPSKDPFFCLKDRIAMLTEELDSIMNGDGIQIEAQSFDDLLVDFARSVGAGIIILGLRAVSDFEYEFQMVGMNQRLNADIETVFLMADPRHQAIASRLVKEIAKLDGDITPFVPELVKARLLEKFV